MKNTDFPCDIFGAARSCGRRGVLALSSGECIFRTKISVTEETIFTIPPGTGRGAGEKLAESGIIPNHTIMTGCCNWSRIWQKSKPVLTA